jgi:hypothetical protein
VILVIDLRFLGHFILLQGRSVPLATGKSNRMARAMAQVCCTASKADLSGHSGIGRLGQLG